MSRGTPANRAMAGTASSTNAFRPPILARCPNHIYQEFGQPAPISTPSRTLGCGRPVPAVYSQSVIRGGSRSFFSSVHNRRFADHDARSMVQQTRADPIFEAGWISRPKRRNRGSAQHRQELAPLSHSRCAATYTCKP